jgi:uncharacterized membrane protein YeaQ/YmgE (transglycosylase-associated protein family)
MFDWQHTMPQPIYVFAFVIATLLGALAHLIRGGGAQRLAVFLLAGWFGFWLGHLAGTTLTIDVFAIGELRIVPAVIGAVFALVVASIFSSGRRRRRSRRS